MKTAGSAMRTGTRGCRAAVERGSGGVHACQARRGRFRVAACDAERVEMLGCAWTSARWMMAIQTGDLIQAYCAQCRINGEAEVVAAVGAEIVTVLCKACGTSQGYQEPVRSRGGGRRMVEVGADDGGSKPRPRRDFRTRSTTGRDGSDSGTRPAPIPPPPVESVAPRPSPAAARAAAALVERWRALTEGVMARDGRPHRARESYEPGEIILNSTWGMGIVEEVAADGTLKVLFRRGYEELPSQEGPVGAERAEPA